MHKSKVDVECACLVHVLKEIVKSILIWIVCQPCSLVAKRELLDGIKVVAIDTPTVHGNDDVLGLNLPLHFSREALDGLFDKNVVLLISLEKQSKSNLMIVRQYVDPKMFDA